MTEKGKCGNCGSKKLSYGASYPDGESYCYPFTCDDCDKSGKEWFNLQYSETIME